jgi:hypothetical protein
MSMENRGRRELVDFGEETPPGRILNGHEKN